MGNLGTETAFEILAKAKALERQGKDIVHLGIGEPDFDTPEHIRKAAKDALDRSFTHYGPSAGLPETREAIARHQTKRQGYPVEAERIVVTPGGKPIMFFTILALVDEGDEVLYPNPGFPIYESMIRFVGGVPVPMRLSEENGFSVDIDEVRRKVSKRTKLMIVNSPSNPCGSVIPDDDLKKLAAIAVEHDIVVMSDEIYKDFYFEGSHTSISRFPGMRERTVILDGFSKSYAMTGWRLGYGVLPDWMAEGVTKLMTNSVSCTASFSQIAAITALDSSQQPVIDMVAEFKRRRELIVKGLNAIKGISCITPKGAFYVFPNIRGTGLKSKEFAEKVLLEAGVATVHGTSFGEYGEGYARLSFANSQANISKALERIDRFLSSRKR
jgi:aspartate/methionine/tyrosine aminotransferase